VTDRRPGPVHAIIDVFERVDQITVCVRAIPGEQLLNRSTIFGYELLDRWPHMFGMNGTKSGEFAII
jgi:hypothetical protein